MTKHAMDPDEEFSRLLDGYQQAIESGQVKNFWEEHPCNSSVRARVMELHSLVGDLARHYQPGIDTNTTAYHLPIDLSVLHRFKIEAEIGRGSYGIVYRAEDPLLKRQVAIKVPRLETMADPLLRDRFRQEAELAAGIDHPHVLPVYEVGTAGQGDYIVTAFCAGSNLAQWLAVPTNRLTHAQIAELIACLAEGLAACHAKNVLHRDLKPANVMLFPIPCGTLPFWSKLTDFGLAKATDSDLAETVGGVFLGTPMYMAPEQASGLKQKIGPATDIYALGAILYELLTKNPPFQADSIAMMLDQVRSLDPIPPTKIDESIPQSLESICLTCLRKAPEDRYKTANALVNELRRFTRGQEIQNVPHRRRILVKVGVAFRWKAAAFLCLAAMGWVAWFNPLGWFRTVIPAIKVHEDGLLFGPEINRIYRADVAFVENSPLTIEAWIRPDQQPGMILNYAGVITLFSGDESQGEGPSIRVAISKDAMIYYHAQEPLVRHQWHHLAATYDREHLQFYIDGQLVQCAITEENSEGLNRLSDKPILKLGQVWPGGAFFIGSNDNKSRVRNRFPYSGRIQSVMVSRSVRYRENFLPKKILVSDESVHAFYVFNPYSAETIKDRSGNQTDAFACKLFDE